jgi:electron transport complex protein RnfC
MSRIKGIYVPHNKNTAACVPQAIATPKEVRLPMKMHSGSPAVPVVKVGETVKIGQLIGAANGRVSSPVHASVAGKVKSIDELNPITGDKGVSIAIAADEEQAVFEDITPPVVTSVAQFLDAVQNSGVVGLGGAGYPTAPKITLKEGVNLDYILINGAECEPYITSDTRAMVDNATEVFEGCVLLKKYINPKQIIICIEDNKPEAIAGLEDMAKDVPGISVQALPSYYPQGERKVLVYNITGRIVPEGARLTDVGCIVLNCTTVAVFAHYINTGMPLTHRIVTVDGSAVRKPQNVIAPIGTPINDIFEHCGGLTEDVDKIIMGGAMMGLAVPSTQMPLLKCNNALLAFNKEDSKPAVETACIKCGICIEKCPMKLMPSFIEKAYESKDIKMLTKLKVGMCIECGCCAYLCPANRPLVQATKIGSNMEWEARRK